MHQLDYYFNLISNYLSLSKVYVKLTALLLIAIFSISLSRYIFGIFKRILTARFKLSVNLIDLKFRIVSSVFLTVIILNLVLPVFHFTDALGYFLQKLLFISFVFSIAFLLIKITEFVKDYIYYYKAMDINDNLSNRKIRTQIGFLQKVITVFIIMMAVSIVLMSFSKVREIGTSIIASAGIAGVILGFAAQKSLANLLAGLQIAFTQPVRIDDVVVVENEWGRIEELTLTYVVVKIWDERRLILPISYFIEKPFQNWTRNSSQIVGTIFLYVDYTVPVDALRNKMMETLRSTHLWDGRVGALQITELTEKSVQLRGIMSSSNASDSWDLKCLVRENLIKFISEQYPGSLPHLRSKSFPV